MSDSSSHRTLPIRFVLLVAVVAGATAGAATLPLIGLLAPPPATGVDVSSKAESPVLVPTAPPAIADDELARLREALELAEAERSQLAGTLLDLNRRSEEIERRLTALSAAAAGPTDVSVPPGSDAPDAADAMLPSGETGDVIVAGETEEDGPRDRRQEERESLLAAGLDPQSVDELTRRRDEYELQRLELLDRAAREGWLETERLDESLETLEASRPDLREELGDEAYDRYLYERGRGNRVGIASVMSGSVAERAGLERGDIIVSYAGERVFRLPELQDATRAGSYGESVQLSVRRGNEVVAIDVPRGPLGVQLRSRRLSPG